MVAALGLADGVIDTELDGVGVNAQPPAKELHVAHPQRHSFTQEGLADQTDADHHEHGWRETLAKLSDVLEETGGMHE
jgi:hypothetical protein